MEEKITSGVSKKIPQLRLDIGVTNLEIFSTSIEGDWKSKIAWGWPSLVGG